MVISEKQQESNRRNAQKSTGPTTPEGKQAAALNAVTYGLRTRRLIIRGENIADYWRLWDDLENEWQPATKTERLYLEQMSVSQWLLARMAASEHKVYQAGLWLVAGLKRVLGAGFRVLGRGGLRREDRRLRRHGRRPEVAPNNPGTARRQPRHALAICPRSLTTWQPTTSHGAQRAPFLPATWASLGQAGLRYIFEDSYGLPFGVVSAVSPGSKTAW